jgi:ribonuclease D
VLQFVTTQEELAAVCDRLLHEPVVALDTEFLWERTYYPILGLVQIAVANGGCFLLDTVRLDSLRPLGPVLAAPGSVKILHDAREDLSILLREVAKSGQCFKPANIFDTRLAAGFAGLSSAASLKTLLAKLLDIHLAKTETRSNWIRRPLRDAQVRYAADDVIYLPRLRDALLERCPSARVRRWLDEEMRRYDDPSFYAGRDPREMWLHVSGFTRPLTENEKVQAAPRRYLAVLRELAAWRETLAQMKDWPPRHVLTDPMLITLASEQPRNVRAFRDLNEIPKHLPDAVAAKGVDAIQRGLSIPDSDCPDIPFLSESEREQLRKQIASEIARVNAACGAEGIDPAVVISKARLERIFRDNLPNPLETGWRKELLALQRKR